MKFAWKLIITTSIIAVIVFNNISFAFDQIYLIFPAGDAYIDAAGYSDVIDWGWSDYHPHDSHELLSGEWGAAIYYGGNPKEPNAMWLTNQFLSPNWSTDCNFSVNSYNAWNDLNNPVIDNDTGRSVISNSQTIRNFKKLSIQKKLKAGIFAGFLLPIIG